jgi:hypothetical protein
MNNLLLERIEKINEIKKGLDNFICLKIDDVLVHRINAYLVSSFLFLASIGLYTYDEIKPELIKMKIEGVVMSPANSYTEDLLMGNDLTIFKYKIEVYKKLNKKIKWIIES